MDAKPITIALLYALICTAFCSAQDPPLQQPEPPEAIAEPTAPPPKSARRAPLPEMVAPGNPAASQISSALTLEDLEGTALSNNPTLARAAARVRAVQGQWLQVGLPPNPSAGYVGSEVGQEGTAGQQGGFVGQQFVTAHKLRLNRAVVAQDIRQAQRQFEAQRLRVLNDVRILYFETLIAQRTAELAGELVRIGERGGRAAQQLFEAKEASRIDVVQARIEVNAARIILQNARNRYFAAWRALAAAIGVPDMDAAPLVGDLDHGIANLTWAEALGSIQAASPELGAARAAIDRARWALRRAQVEPIPNLQTIGMAQYDNSSRFTIAGAQIGVNVPLYDRNQGGIRRAQAELASAIGDARRVELNLQTRLAAAFERYANARQQVERYRNDILPDARASLDLAVSGYQQGEFTFLSLLNAQRTYFQTNLAYIDALRQLRVATVQIEGLLLTDSLQEQGPGPAEPNLTTGQ